MGVLSGCSSTNTSSATATAPAGAPPDYIPSNNVNQNCYGYVIGVEGNKNPGRYSEPLPGDEITYLYDNGPVPTSDELQHLVLRDMSALGKSARPINDPSERSNEEYVIAMNIGTTTISGVGFADYHFAIQLSDGTWADKQGWRESRWNALNGTSVVWDRQTPGDGYYDAGTRYIAVGK